jgi:alpha-galactosidase
MGDGFTLRLYARGAVGARSGRGRWRGEGYRDWVLTVVRITTVWAAREANVTNTLSWGHESVTLEFEWDADAPLTLRAVLLADGTRAGLDSPIPFVDIITPGFGHTISTDRLIQSLIGTRLRYRSHRESRTAGWTHVSIRLESPDPAIAVDVELSSPIGVAAVRSRTTVTNLSPDSAFNLQSVTSWVSSFGTAADVPVGFDGWSVLRGRSEWLGEGRWSFESLRGIDFPNLSQAITGVANTPRTDLALVSTGTWSTGKHLAVAGLQSAERGLSWLWQIEHNGPWRAEVGENNGDGYFALSGPTDLDHQWSVNLAPGDSFTTVPVEVAIGSRATDAMRALTGYRRAARRPHPDNAAMPVVFNDYMNTLLGDPTTEKLLPLIDAAAEIGADIFCIDAGWYDETGHWWDSVGEWIPSTTRFPGGLHEVIDRIRDRGMIPGLWLEPEVVGVRSPIAERLPMEAFLLRNGERVAEYDRYHLDFRHPAVIDHLDTVVDRLVTEFGVGFFKLDYNINPGPGTDVDADSVGAGLLEHNRAHLAWLDTVLDRHPNLVIENCSSGAMRMDFAMLSRLHMQSTSDQQDFIKYPPIAATAPLSMLPEQAASWAYPQPEMTLEEVAYCLVTGLLGRFYLSGYLNRMSPAQLALVKEAVVASKSLTSTIQTATPGWPLGLPGWTDSWVALELDSPVSRVVGVWSREVEATTTILSFPSLVGVEVVAHPVFPANLPVWATRWNAATGELTIENGTGSIGARVFELRAG